jgi:Trypsin-like peptidase domain/RNA helicase
MSSSAPSLNPLAELFMRCTVRIRGKIEGSGFFVAPSLILTCAHVAEFAWQTQAAIDVQRRDNQQCVEAHILQFRAIAYPDLALLQIQQTDHPCVLLDEEISLNDQLYAYGYPKNHSNGDPVTLLYEGLTGVQQAQLKLKEGQALPGMSGSPPLNLRTGKVCGILRTTRDERSALGGRAIPVHTILQEFPALVTLQEQFHHLDTQWLRLLPSPTRYSLTSQMVRQVLGPSVQLVQFATVSPASESRSQRYYEGALLSWDVLAANADVSRDVHDELLSYMVNAADQTQVLCLYGKPGAGKSTLAWRLAIEASQLLRRPLLHLRNNEESDIWYKLEDFLAQYEIPSVILVDDIFRDYQARQALTSLNTFVPVLIIATSRSNEIPASLRLPFDPYLQEVTSPTPAEKTHVLQKLGRDEAMLSALERKRLKRANSWLNMMLELTTGKDLEKIVQDTVDRLQQQDIIVYHAYEYLCFSGQYDLEFPETLLDALDERGRFYKVEERRASQGLLTLESDKGTVRIQHALIARQSLQAYQRNPANIAQELINAVQTDQDDHRTFLVCLLSRLVSDQQETMVRNLFTQYAKKIDVILSFCSSGNLLRWARIYYLFHEVEKAIKLEQQALSRSPQTAMDFMAHLILVNRLGSKEQIQQVIEETRKWLTTHPQDTSVRHTYLGLVMHHGSKKQLRQEIEATRTWLTSHPRNTYMRQRYRELLQRLDSKI